MVSNLIGRRGFINSVIGTLVGGGIVKAVTDNAEDQFPQLLPYRLLIRSRGFIIQTLPIAHVGFNMLGGTNFSTLAMIHSAEQVLDGGILLNGKGQVIDEVKFPEPKVLGTGYFWTYSWYVCPSGRRMQRVPELVNDSEYQRINNPPSIKIEGLWNSPLLTRLPCRLGAQCLAQIERINDAD